MQKNIYILTFLLLGSSISTYAQNALFISHGIIEYERSNNMYAMIRKELKDDNVGSAIRFDQYQKQFPQFKLSKSTLVFSPDASLFTPAENMIPNIGLNALLLAMQFNTIYTDYRNSQQTTQKKLFDKTFWVKDSIRTITWKLTDETREIAGFNCRRANALIMDSIFAVAFYTDEIPVAGGPESFGGLPGMILGLALPHYHVSWFAKSVKLEARQNVSIQLPVKGKEIGRKELEQLARDLFKSGGWGEGMLEVFLL